MALLYYTAIRLLNLLFLWRLSYVNGEKFLPKLHLWDGEWMLNLAENGYENQPLFFVDARGLHLAKESYAFFPGYPGLIRGLHNIIPLTFFEIALIINWIAGFIFVLGIMKIGKIIFQTSRLEKSLLWVAIIAASPLAIVFNMVYTEALFCALAVWALYFLLKESWLYASLLIILAGIVRPTASALILTIFVVTIVKARRNPWAWLACALSPLGMIGYLLLVAKKMGSLTAWFDLQTLGWNTKFDFGRSTLWFINYTFCSSYSFIDFVIVASMLLSIFLLIKMFLAKYPLVLTCYATGVLATVLLSNGLMSSRPRLLLVAFTLALPVVKYVYQLSQKSRTIFLSAYIIFGSWFGAYILVVYPYAI